MTVEDRFPDLTREHREIWAGFTTLLKAGSAVCIVLLVLLALFVV